VEYPIYAAVFHRFSRVFPIYQQGYPQNYPGGIILVEKYIRNTK